MARPPRATNWTARLPAEILAVMVRTPNATPARLLALACIALATVGTSGCSDEPGSATQQHTSSASHLSVVARIGGEPVAPIMPAKSKVQTTRLSAVAHPAIRLYRGPGLTVSSNERAVEIHFSLATPDPKARGVRYRVLAADAAKGDWREIFRQEYTPSKTPAAWTDHRIRLGEDEPSVNAFRFVLEFLDPTIKRPHRAFAGAIRILGERAGERPPNIMLVSLDTLGARYMGFYGNSVPTSPALDEWFGQSFTFRRTYAQYGNTLVSHSSLFSGLYPRTHGRILSSDKLPDLDSLIAKFAAAGYLTAAITENAFVSSGLGFANGFDRYDDGPNKLLRDMKVGERTGAEETFGNAEAWLEAYRDSAPFVLFVHTYEVHSPYVNITPQSRKIASMVSPKDTRDLGWRSGGMINDYNRGTRELTPFDLRRLSGHYQGRIRDLDDRADELFQALKNQNLNDETIVAVTADHGEQFGQYDRLGHGQSLHGAALQVPLAFRWPGRIRPGRADHDVELIDVVPTLLDLAGLPVPDHVEGRSLAPLLLGEKKTLAARPSFAEMLLELPNCKPPTDPRCRSHSVTVRLGGWKLIRNLDGSQNRLVNLDQDPDETEDLAASEPARVAALGELIDRYMAGRIDRPNQTGSRFTDDLPDELSERLRALGYLD